MGQIKFGEKVRFLSSQGKKGTFKSQKSQGKKGHSTMSVGKKVGRAAVYECAEAKAQVDVIRRQDKRRRDACEGRNKIDRQYYAALKAEQALLEDEDWSSYYDDTDNDEAASKRQKSGNQSGNQSGNHQSEEPGLCAEQVRLVDLVLSGVNVFYTGGAGTGKSTVLKAIVRRLKQGKKRVEVVTPTGISAVNVNGSTYFSFAGWNPAVAKKSITEICEMTWTKGRRERMRETDVLIVDEISMLESNQFRRLDRACQRARDSSAAFGGMQVVVTGDFYQLPPVKAFQTCFECGCELGVSLKCGKCGDKYDMDDQWPFRSDTWQACRFEYVCLRQIHRQTDPVFISMLNRLRKGQALQADQLALLQSPREDEKEWIELSAIRKDVERKNREGLAGLDGRLHIYKCQDYVHIQAHHPSLAGKAMVDGVGGGVLVGCRDHRLPALLETRVGMPVILLAKIGNVDGLVNGSQGRIVDFQAGASLMGERAARVADSGAFGHLEEEQIARWVGGQEQESSFAIPIVRFENGRTQAVLPLCQDTLLGDPAPFSVVARTQIPLLPAWAITIHKSQGMTLSRGVINLDKIFEQQMAYVGMSRMRDLKGLRVNGVGLLQKEGGDKVVRDFMNEVEG